MLEPINNTDSNKNKVDSSIFTGISPDIKLLDVSNIHPDSTFECYAYIRNGQHKYTKADKPFITLYLQDINGVVIPGYIFDIANFKASGLELTKVLHTVVKLECSENYLHRYGMTVIINKVYELPKASPALITKFVGSVDEIYKIFENLKVELSQKMNKNVTLPFAICEGSYIDYYQGKTGGLCLHYYNTLHILDVWASTMTDQEKYQLYATFILFIIVHSRYLASQEEGKDDILLVQTLTNMISKYMKMLKVEPGVSEVIHMFFGYKPKDIYVRMVNAASESNMRAIKELSVYRALPISREGDAGYGTIKRYVDTI